MSGFPGPPPYDKVIARQLREEREANRTEPEPVQRTADADDLCDALWLRSALLKNTDPKSSRLFEAAAAHIRALERQLSEINKRKGQTP